MEVLKRINKNEDDKLMSIIYNKENKHICAICSGGDTPLSICADGITDNQAELLYGKIVLPYDKYVILHSYMFKLNDKLELVLEEEYKHDLSKYM